jgi:hypothetical protein
MDWGTVIPTIVTGVVGIAGIGGSIIAAKIASKSAVDNLRISISAEDVRAQRAEKRLIYAKCLAAMAQYRELSWGLPPFNADLMASTGPTDLTDVRSAVAMAVSEVELVGSSDAITAARRISLITMSDGRLGGSGDFAQAYFDLVEAARADLDLTEAKDLALAP